MKRNPKIEKVSAKELVVSHDVNFRDDYDIPSMMLDLQRFGRILEPITAEKETKLVLKGNRRIAAAQTWLADAACPAELRKNLEQVEVIWLSELTDRERTEIVLDHGMQKPLSRVETIKAVWRLQKQTYSEKEISLMMYQQLAQFTGNTRKALEAQSIPPGDARDQFIQKWLHGTNGNIIMGIGRMGDLVKEQYLLTELAKDRALTDEEKKRVKFDVTNKRVNLLSSAKKADKDDKTGKGWTPEAGGENFNARIAEFIAEDKSGGTSRNKRFSADQMEQTAEAMQSGLRLAFLQCAGKLPEGEKSKLDVIDTEYARRDKVFSVLTQNHERLNDSEVKSLVDAILHGSPDEVISVLNKFVTTAVA